MSSQPWHLFDVYGIEIEYMVVDRQTLTVRPIVDRILRDANDRLVNELPHGEITWCNELARHVVELKCHPPLPRVEGAADLFQRNIEQLNQRLADHQAMLLPGGMHPWMDPDRELALWPSENREIYQAYDDIFSCRGHGWANLQSVQINLPYANSDEFGRLHAAIRCVLPLLCGLAASTPYADGRYSGFLDYRMEVYRHNSRRVPQVAGAVMPESVDTPEAYQQQILTPMYQAIAPLDPNQVLQEDWLNSRGAIPRFERQSIEIRTLDSQECIAADIAIVDAVSSLTRGLCEERWSSRQQQRDLPDNLAIAVFIDSLTQAENAEVDSRIWSELFDLPKRHRTLGTLWGELINKLVGEGMLQRRSEAPLETIISRGTLASRLVRAIDAEPTSAVLAEHYSQLAHCLNDNQMFNTAHG
ncbi:MAG: glutamate-cysteine ligase family protein [Wenzhouxiangellaceae bacterium]